MLCSSNTPDELVEPCIRAMASAHKSEVRRDKSEDNAATTMS